MSNQSKKILTDIIMTVPEVAKLIDRIVGSANTTIDRRNALKTYSYYLIKHTIKESKWRP